MKISTIHDLPRIEKPREKLERYGVEALQTEELLAIILRTGRKGKNVLQISKELINKFGAELVTKTKAELSQVEGIGSVKASEIIACFELGRRFLQNKKHRILSTPKEIFEALADIRNQKKEHFIVFFLDSRNQEIKRETISIGTVNTSIVHPREVFEPAIKNFSNSVVLAHNHPSGNLEPSNADLVTTKRLVEGGKILGIEVVDHVIVSNNSWLSMKERGIII